MQSKKTAAARSGHASRASIVDSSQRFAAEIGDSASEIPASLNGSLTGWSDTVPATDSIPATLPESSFTGGHQPRESTTTVRPAKKGWAASVILAVFCYGALAALGYHFKHQQDLFPTFWIATAALAGYLFRVRPGVSEHSYAKWATTLVLALVVHVGLAQTIWPSEHWSLDVTMAVCSLIEASGIALVSQMVMDKPARLNNDFRLFGRLLLANSAAVPFASAVLATVAFWSNPYSSPFLTGTFASVMFQWFSTSVLGILTVFPAAALSSAPNWREGLRRRKLAEALALAIVSVAVVYLSGHFSDQPYVLILMPLLVAAVRLPLIFVSTLSAATVILLIAFHSIPGMMQAKIEHPLDTPLTLLTIASVLIPVLLLSVLIGAIREDRRRRMESDSRFRDALRYSVVGMALVKPDGKWVQVSASLATLLGHTEKSLQFGNFFEIFDVDLGRSGNRSPMEEEIRKVVTGELPFVQRETKVCNSIGESIDVLLTAGAVKGLSGKTRYLIIQIEDIRRRLQAEMDLADTERRWSLALEASGVGVWDWEVQNGQAWFSDRWKRLLGYEPIDAIDDHVSEWHSRIHPEDHARVMAMIDQTILGSQETYVIEYRMRCKDGSYKWFRDSGGVFERDKKMVAKRLIGTHADITTKKTSEIRQQILTERMQLAQSAGSLGVWEWIDKDENGLTKIILDDAASKIFGFPQPQENYRLSEFMARVHKEDRPQVLEMFHQSSQQENLEGEFRLVFEDDRIRYVRMMATFVADSEGQAKRAVGVTWDTTEKVCSANELIHQKDRLQVTLNSIADGVITTDAKGFVTFMNPVAETLTGWTSQEAEGIAIEDVFRIERSDDHSERKNLVRQCMLTKQRYSMDEGIVLLNRHGGRFEIQDRVSPLLQADGEVMGAVLVFQDITEAQEMQRRLSFAAEHDVLTGLYNRGYFEQSLEKALNDSRNRKADHVLCFIDLDRFKIVNDSAGHGAGDALLREIGSKLKESVRPNDLVARIGGDEFALLMYECSVDESTKICNKIIETICSIRFPWEGHVYDIGASIGIVPVTHESKSSADLISQADVACYASKHAGRNRYSVYRPGQSEADQKHKEIFLAAGLREAMDQDRFVLHLQEIVPTLDPGEEEASHRHYEVLIRMLDRDGKIVPPGAFIPPAERYGLMGDLDRWVVRAVIQKYGARMSRIPGFKIGINLSANSMSDPEFLPFVLDIIGHSPMRSRSIYFEITETALMNHLSVASNLVSKLREIGCQVALDDFGSGLSSFNYLKNFSVDYIKIDGSFIRQLHTNQVDWTIVDSMNQVAHRLGAETIAEFVENQTIFSEVRRIGIDYAQGYGVGRPRPIESVLKELEDEMQQKTMKNRGLVIETTS